MTISKSLSESDSESNFDRGWSWITVIAAFIVMAIVLGEVFTFGPLFLALMKDFDEGYTQTAFIGSIQTCMLHFPGIFFGFLLKRCSANKVTIFGAFLMSTGHVISSFSTSIYLLYFTYGILTGVGGNAMYLAAITAVTQLFERRRALATGVVLSGSGIGVLIYGYISEMIIRDIGWRSYMRVLALLNLICVLCGAVYQSADNKNNKKGGKRINKNEKSIDINDKTYLFTDEDEVDEAKDETSCFDMFKAFKKLKGPAYVLFTSSYILFCFGYIIPFSYIPVRAKSIGIKSQDSATLVSLIGVANISSRFLFGWLGDKSAYIRFVMAGSSLLLSGISLALISLLNSFEMMTIFSVLFGTFNGCWISLYAVVLADIYGAKTISISLGFLLTFGSCAYLISPPIAGAIISMTGSVDNPFHVAGALTCASSLLYFLILYFWRPDQKYQEIEIE